MESIWGVRPFLLLLLLATLQSRSAQSLHAGVLGGRGRGSLPRGEIKAPVGSAPVGTGDGVLAVILPLVSAWSLPFHHCLLPERSLKDLGPRAEAHAENGL